MSARSHKIRVGQVEIYAEDTGKEVRLWCFFTTGAAHGARSLG